MFRIRNIDAVWFTAPLDDVEHVVSDIGIDEPAWNAGSPTPKRRNQILVCCASA